MGNYRETWYEEEDRCRGRFRLLTGQIIHCSFSSYKVVFPEQFRLPSPVRRDQKLSDTMQKKWIITGASQGLGLALAMSALKAGHSVLAGARNPLKAAKEHPELEAAGGKWLELDVT